MEPTRDAHGWHDRAAKPDNFFVRRTCEMSGYLSGLGGRAGHHPDMLSASRRAAVTFEP